VADKITQQLTDALAKAATHPGGLPLYAGKTEPGLFPNTPAVKLSAQKGIADALIRIVHSDTKGKTPRDLYALTDAGWEFLLAQVNPKQVLEDFVRVLEARQGEVGELLATARKMAESLQGLREAVARVLPVVTATRMPLPVDRMTAFTLTGLPSNGQAELSGSIHQATVVAQLDPETASELAPTLLARLAEWSGPTDCTLPELFQSLWSVTPSLTIGQFHDCLRTLVAEGVVSLHSWTGPLYALPEPAYALLVGHGIAYYASSKSGQWAVNPPSLNLTTHDPLPRRFSQ